jgi:hypothetical protein
VISKSYKHAILLKNQLKLQQREVAAVAVAATARF